MEVRRLFGIVIIYIFLFTTFIFFYLNIMQNVNINRKYD